MKKRILSLTLVLIMVLTMLPLGVFAENTQPSITVSFTTQAAGEFLCAPQYNLEVSSNLAEEYGYVDKITDGVSALDVLVKAHEEVFGKDKDTINSVLSTGESGWLTDVFGCGSNFGFTVNGKTPHDNVFNETYQAYTGYAIDATKIENKDNLEFFIYQDDEYSLDNYIWFEQNGNKVTSVSAESRTDLTVTVKGYCIAYYGCSKDETIESMTEAIEDAHLCLINKETGEKTDISGAVTDENGNVTFSITDVGDYLLSAYITEEDITEYYSTPAIMTLLPLTITEPAPSAMSDADAVNTIYTEFSTKANNYTSATNTPLLFPLEYDGETYTNVISYMKAWGKKETGRDINISFNGNTASTIGYSDWRSGNQTKYVPVAFNETTEISQNYFKDNLPLSQRIGNIVFSIGETKSDEIKPGIYAKVKSVERTPEEIVEYISENLPFERIKGKNGTIDYIVNPLGEGTTTIALPIKDELYTSASANITWSLVPEVEGDTSLKLSSNKITVTRPNVGEPDSKFTLKAEIVSVIDENIKRTVEYYLTVPAFEEIVVPIQITEGATLSIKDGVYNADVADKYIVKQENAPEGYDLYHLSLHSNTTGTEGTFTYTISKDGYITKTQTQKVGTTAPTEATVINLVQSSENDTKLSSLKITTPSVNGFEFNPDVTEYNIEIAGGQYINLAGLPFVSESDVKIASYYKTLANANTGTLTTTGTKLSNSGVKCYLPDTAGTSVVKITVTAPAGSTQEAKIKEYTLNITKTGANTPLTALTLTASSSGKGIKNTINLEEVMPEETLTPEFVSGAKENAYSYTVNYYRDKIKVKPTAANCTITVNGATVESGKVSEPIDIAVGDNEITVNVVNETNATEYKIIVHRKAELKITDVTLDNGTLNTTLPTDGSDWTGSCSFSYDAEKVNVTYDTNITENVIIKLISGNKEYSGVPGEPIEIDVKGIDKFIPDTYLIYNNNGIVEAQKYVISLNRSASAHPSNVESFLPAPGQFVNIDTYMAPGKILSDSGAISLGAFGGNVVYKYDEPIKNSKNNPYGIDFIIAGNAFADSDGGTSSGSAEPASVMVSKNGVNWYELAGSEYYSADTERNITVTYTNPDITFEKAVDVPYIFSNGETGNVLANNYHKQAYYPNPVNYNIFQSGVGKNNTYTAESVTFEGTRIKNGFYPFGYADSHTYVKGNTAANPYAENHKYVYNGDGFDISWAVDAEGNPVELDEISYIKIYNPVMFDGGSTGEKSPEISKITKVQSENSAVGVSAGLTKLTVSGKEITLQNGVYSYTVDAENASAFEIVPQAQNANANIYISNVRVASGDTAKLTAVDKLRIIVQESKCEPVIYMLQFTNAQTAESNADLKSLTLTPGDVTKTPDNENAVSFDVANSIASIRITAATAGKDANVSISGGSIADTISFKNGEQSPAISINEGKNEFVVAVTSKDTTNTKTYNITVNRAEVASDTQSENTISVKFSLVGDKVHYDKEKEEYTGSHSVQNWINQTSVTIPKDSTVKYLTEMMLNNAKIDYKSNGVYVSEINGLAEFDNGPDSGWMYRHNGQIADEGYAARKLKNGDIIKWFYTDDYTKETGYEGGWDSVNKDHSTKQDTAETVVKEEVKSTITGETAKAQVSEKIIENLTKNADEKKADTIVIVPETKDNTKNVEVVLPKTALSEMAKSSEKAISIETNVGSVTIPSEALSSITEQAKGKEISVEVKAKDINDIKDSIKNTIDDNLLEKAIVVEVNIISGGLKITSFGGNDLTLTLPASKEHKIGEKYVVLAIGDDGTVSQMTGVCTKDGIVVTTSHLTSFVVTDKKVISFTDIENHWAKAYIEDVASKDLMKGVSETSFAPDETMTRAMFVTVLYRIEGEPKVSECKFGDVEKASWYENAVAWANEKGIVTGITDTEFAPNTKITREQMATILYRYKNYKGEDVSIGENTNILSYDDAFEIAEYAYSALQWACGTGIISGKSNEILAPKDEATRAETATMLVRMIDSDK